MQIVLDVIGTQRIGREKDKIEMTTVAELEQSDDCYIVNYTEEQEPPYAPIHVCVKINKDERRVEMSRTGEYNSILIIEKSNRNLCHYNTEYGDILMGISGHTIDADFNDQGGQFIFAYDLDINGALASKNVVKLIFKYNQE